MSLFGIQKDRFEIANFLSLLPETDYFSTFLVPLFGIQRDRFRISRRNLIFGFSDFASFGIQRDRFEIANFLSPLAKIDEFLDPSCSSFCDLGTDLGFKRWNSFWIW